MPSPYATRLDPPPETPEAYPFPSTRCVRFGVEDVVRSAAAAESVEILARIQADEAAAAPQVRCFGFAAQALRNATHRAEPPAAAGPAAPPTTELPAAAPLPTGWHQFHHPESGKPYYSNSTTSETTWEVPVMKD